MTGGGLDSSDRMIEVYSEQVGGSMVDFVLVMVIFITAPGFSFAILLPVRRLSCLAFDQKQDLTAPQPPGGLIQH